MKDAIMVDRERSILFSTCEITGNTLWFFAYVENIFMKMDLGKNEIHYLDTPDGYCIEKSTGADIMLSDGNKVYVLELNGKYMMEYDTIQNSCKYYDIECNVSEWVNFAALAKFEKYIYIFQRYMGAVVKVDLETGAVYRRPQLYDEMQKYCEQDEDGLKICFSCGCVVGEFIWLFMEKRNIAVKYNMREESYEQYKLPEWCSGCYHVVYKNGLFYILDRNGNVFTWNSDTNDSEMLMSWDKKEKDPFMRIAVTDTNIWVLPALEDDIYTISKETGKAEKYRMYPDDIACWAQCEWSFWSKYYGICEDNDNYYLAMRSMNYMLIINKKSGLGKWIKPELPLPEERFRFYRKNQKNLIMEKICSKEDFLEEVCREISDENTGTKNNVGINVWELIKNY